LGIIISFMQVIALIALWILQYLLSTDFMTDPLMMAQLNQIWVLSRDLVNLAFALMLIGVAIYTIITAKQELIKGKLVQFCMAVILVNFSWFFPRVIIDIANVLTSTVYSIPNMLPGFNCEMRDDNGNLRPCRVLLDVLILPEPNAKIAYCASPLPVPGTVVNCDCLPSLVCYKEGEFTAAASVAPGHAMINGLAVSFARLNALAKVPASIIGAPGTTQNVITISLRLLVSTVLISVLLMAATLPLVGLAIGLVIRMVILWVCVAFMPFAFLGYAWNGKLGIPGADDKFNIWDNFKSAAFLPAVVAIPFCIGFMMLSATAQVQSPTTGLVLNVPIVNGVNDWWGLMWLCAAIGIIYIGAFSALESNKIIGQATSKVKAFGDGVVGIASAAPMLIPLPLPGPGGGTQTLGQLVNKPQQIKNAIQQSALSGKSLKESLAGQQGGTTTQGGLNIEATNKILSSNSAENQRIVTAIQQLNNSGLSGAARQQKLEELTSQLNARLPAGSAQLTANNVLPELRQIAQRQGSGGILRQNLAQIEGAIKAGSGT
jgi:hypothetical protein